MSMRLAWAWAMECARGALISSFPTLQCEGMSRAPRCRRRGPTTLDHFRTWAFALTPPVPMLVHAFAHTSCPFMIARAQLIDVLFVIVPHSLLLDIAGPAEAFRLANQHREAARTAAALSSPLRRAGGNPADARSDWRSATSFRCRSSSSAPTWVVVVGQPTAHVTQVTPEIATTARWLQRRLHDALLDARHAASPGDDLLGHAARRARRAARHAPLHDAPRAAATRCARWRRRRRSIDNRVFVVDGPLASSAGITAGIDVALHLIAEECGEALAASVAEDMVVYLRRSPRDHRAVAVPHAPPPPASDRAPRAGRDRLRAASATGTWPRWPHVGHATERHLLRLFIDHAGISPLHYLRLIRLERARQSLEYGATVTRAAAVAGFGSDLQLRRAWSRQWGGSPRDVARERRERSAVGHRATRPIT